MMKKKPSAAGKSKASPKAVEKETAREPSHGYDTDTEEGTFGSWLRSGEGVQLMKLFVIGNSLVVFLTMSWPHLKHGLNAAYWFFSGEELF